MDAAGLALAYAVHPARLIDLDVRLDLHEEGNNLVFFTPEFR